MDRPARGLRVLSLLLPLLRSLQPRLQHPSALQGPTMGAEGDHRAPGCNFPYEDEEEDDEEKEEDGEQKKPTPVSYISF